MNSFFIEFRDPLFGVIVLFALVFVITFISYWWGKYKSQEDLKSLDRFLQQFNSSDSQNELKVLISKGELSEKSWVLLAELYAKNGDYEKSLEIYSELVKINKNKNYIDTMFLLGQTYFKAGFLQRAKEIFLEILKKKPRTPQALNGLLLVYEYTKEYSLAIEVLDSLSELDEDIKIDATYIKTLYLLNDNSLDKDIKVEKLLEIYKTTNILTYMIFDYIFKVDVKVAWRNLDLSKCKLLVDILWQIDKKDLDLDIISTNGYLRELYTARGDIDMAESSSEFEFDVLIKLKDKKDDITLSFEYSCDNCKQVYPFSFTRCSRCHSIDKSIIEIELSKKYNMDFNKFSNSFQ